MALRANRIRLGIFFVLIMAVFIAAIVWLAGGLSRPATTSYACYFGWSVGGLNVGSTVEYNGVPVGSVTSIEIAPDGRLVKVVLHLEDDKFMVDDTIVASLFITGITGLRDINLESLPDSVPRLWGQNELSFDSDMAVIPVRTGAVQSITSGLNSIFEMVDQIDMKELNDQTILALSRINGILDSVETDSVAGRVRETMDNIDELLLTYNNLGLELTETVRRLEADADPILDDVQEFTARLDELTVQLENLSYDLHDTFNNSNMVLQEIRALLPRVSGLLEGFSGNSSGEDVWQ